MTTPKPIRERLPGDVAAAVATVSAMGRVMLSAAAGGATHERIGTVERVSAVGDVISLAGAAHDSAIDLSVIRAVVADRSGRMKDRVLPRLELQDVAGETCFSLIALDGLEPFDAALSRLGAGEVLPEKTRAAPPVEAPATEAGEDAGAKLLNAVAASGETVAVRFKSPGLDQQWAGAIREIKPAMGFLNIIEPDFHLHLKERAVARWRWRQVGGLVECEAEAADGSLIGLTLSGPPAAFAGA
jgi:putative heme degradation protein